MWKSKIGIIIIFISLVIPVSFSCAGTILATHKYAWSNNIGYINFENVIVNDSNLSGFAWSEKSGWIKFNPAKGGVYNDGNGHLSGFAWGEGLGWIDFSGVNVSTTTGKFSGSASGPLVGTINFDCPNYCDVRTDWTVAPIIPPVNPPITPTTTPIVTPVITSTSHTSSGSRMSQTAGIYNSVHVDTIEKPLVIAPQQSGSLKKQTLSGLVTIDIPANNVLGITTFFINQDLLDTSNKYLVLGNTRLINGAFYDIYALDQNSLYVHYFNKPLFITLPLSIDLQDRDDLGLYWLNETNWKWVLIPDAIFGDTNVSFSVDHLTKFAIFAMQNSDDGSGEVDSSNILSTNIPESLTLPPSQMSNYLDNEKAKMEADQLEQLNLLESTSTLVSETSSGMWAIIFLVLAIFIIIIYMVKRKK